LGVGQVIDYRASFIVTGAALPIFAAGTLYCLVRILPTRCSSDLNSSEEVAFDDRGRGPWAIAHFSTLAMGESTDEVEHLGIHIRLQNLNNSQQKRPPFAMERELLFWSA
jgi:hypothetical protein